MELGGKTAKRLWRSLWEPLILLAVSDARFDMSSISSRRNVLTSRTGDGETTSTKSEATN